MKTRLPVWETIARRRMKPYRRHVVSPELSKSQRAQPGEDSCAETEAGLSSDDTRLLGPAWAYLLNKAAANCLSGGSTCHICLAPPASPHSRSTGSGIWPTPASILSVHFGLKSLCVIAIPAIIAAPFLWPWAPKLTPRARGASIHWGAFAAHCH